MSDSHPNCGDGHVCQRTSGRVCIENSCTEAAGTLWGPLWCPRHDKLRLDAVSAALDSIAASLARPVVAAVSGTTPTEGNDHE